MTINGAMTSLSPDDGATAPEAASRSATPVHGEIDAASTSALAQTSSAQVAASCTGRAEVAVRASHDCWVVASSSDSSRMRGLTSSGGAAGTSSGGGDANAQKAGIRESCVIFENLGSRRVNEVLIRAADVMAKVAPQPV